ncbi:hypothetical protein GCM10027075_18130 [Streptomyces heilongjiangensis]
MGRPIKEAGRERKAVRALGPPRGSGEGVKVWGVVMEWSVPDGGRSRPGKESPVSR